MNFRLTSDQTSGEIVSRKIFISSKEPPFNFTGGSFLHNGEFQVNFVA